MYVCSEGERGRARESVSRARVRARERGMEEGREGGRERDICCSVCVFEWQNMLPLSPASPRRALSIAWSSMHAPPWRSSAGINKLCKVTQSPHVDAHIVRERAAQHCAGMQVELLAADSQCCAYPLDLQGMQVELLAADSPQLSLGAILESAHRVFSCLIVYHICGCRGTRRHAARIHTPERGGIG